MNDVIQNIFTRRSIRDFSDKKVSKKDVEMLIQTGLYAPSGMCKQTWNIIGVLNENIVNELAHLVESKLNRPKYNFYGAKTLIILSNDKDSPWGRDDNACAMQNIMLAAHSLDIGSVWINQLTGNCEVPEIREVLTRIGVPENHVIYGLVALGYSKSEPKGTVEKIGKFSIVE